MSRPRIGILTFHRCINYGSYWQARCLVEGLINKGYDAEILDYTSNRVNFAEWRCALQPVLPSRVSKSDVGLYRKKTDVFLRAVEQLPMSRAFPLDQPARMDWHDVVVVGSDEVWNLQHPWLGDQAAFFGVGLQAGRRVTYAASAGSYSAWTGLPAWHASMVRRFDRISVRDENTRAMLQQDAGIAAVIVADPCLVFELHAEARATMDKPYVAVYGHNFSTRFASFARQFSRRHGWKLVSVGYRNEWADEQRIVADPHDFACWMKHATAIASNFFHGCIFALKFDVPIACEPSVYRSIKIPDLMALTGASRHCIGENASYADFEHAMHQPPLTGTRQAIERLRGASTVFLEEALPRIDAPACR